MVCDLRSEKKVHDELKQKYIKGFLPLQKSYYSFGATDKRAETERLRDYHLTPKFKKSKKVKVIQ